MQEIKRLDIESVAIVGGGFYTITGIIYGLVFMVTLGGVRGVGALIGILLGSFVLGAIGSAITALLYNGISRFAGGIEVEIELVDSDKPAADSGSSSGVSD